MKNNVALLVLIALMNFIIGLLIYLGLWDLTGESFGKSGIKIVFENLNQLFPGGESIVFFIFSAILLIAAYCKQMINK